MSNSPEDLRNELMEEYSKFMKGVFRKANEENSLKKKVYALLEEYLDDEDNKRNLTLGGLLKLLQEVNRSDNEFVVGLLGALTKNSGKEGGGLVPQTQQPVEKPINPEPGQQDGPATVAQARALLNLFEEARTSLKKSET